MYSVYIDESGDEGLSRKSKPWFVVAAIIVDEDEEADIRGFEDECKQKVWIENGHSHPPNQIHFRMLRHSQRMGVCQLFAQKQFRFISMAFYKPRLDRDTVFGECQSFYRYAIRFLLERVSWYVDDRGEKANLIFSNRRNFKISNLIDYIMHWTYSDDSEIRVVFSPKKIRAKNASGDEMLRAADICASSIGCALNPDEYGIIKPGYATELKDHLYTYKNGRIWTYGFKAFPFSPKELYKTHPHFEDWLNKKQA